MLGWVINVSEDRFPQVQTRQEEREQPAVFWIDGVPVWEVWYYSHLVRKWFVMSELTDSAFYPKNEVVFYSDMDALRAEVAAAVQAKESAPTWTS